MVQVSHEVIVPLRPNLNFPKKGKPTLVHVHIHNNSKKLHVLDAKHGKKLNLNKYHPFLIEYIQSMVKEAMTACSLRFWNEPEAECKTAVNTAIEAPRT